MTNAAQALPRRAVILEHLSQDPARGLTAHDLAHVVSTPAGSLVKLLRSMEQHAQLVAVPEWRPQQGRMVSLWRIAPPGAVPPPPRPLSPERLERRRSRNTEAQRARRARLREQLHPSPRPPSLPPGAACAGENPELFFPATPENEAKAKGICAACPIRSECYAVAQATGQTFGVWGGVNFETARGDAR
jgi:hypothetical protein